MLVKNLQYCQQNKGLEIYAYVIMSNHIHLIARVSNGTLGELLRDFKGYTAKQIIKMIENNQQESRQEWLIYMFKYFGKAKHQDYQFWQHKNHPIELYSAEVIMQKINYVHNNPVKCGLVASPEHYLYSSAYEFSDIKVLTV